MPWEVSVNLCSLDKLSNLNLRGFGMWWTGVCLLTVGLTVWWLGILAFFEELAWWWAHKKATPRRRWRDRDETATVAIVVAVWSLTRPRRTSIQHVGPEDPRRAVCRRDPEPVQGPLHAIGRIRLNGPDL